MREQLKTELERALAELRAHRGSWEYAYAMGSGRDGASSHPLHWATHARTKELETRVRHLEARLAEHDPV